MTQMLNTPHFQPPMRDGVGASQVFLPPLDSPASSIYAYLLEHFAHITATEWQQRFEQGLVIDQHGQALTINSAYTPQCHIYYYRFLSHEIHVPFKEKILFENDDLMVVDKPHFLTMSPTGQYVQETLLVRLKKASGNAELTPIHRLDRETAGVVLFSKRRESRGAYQQMFAQGLIEKEYHAIAAYRAELNFPCELELRLEKGSPFYTMQVVDGVANSSTHIELLEHHGAWAKYRLLPRTGKQHQLRVHLNHLGIPIRYDSFYPVIAHKKPDDFSQALQLLAKQISFLDPVTGCRQLFCSEYALQL